MIQEDLVYSDYVIRREYVSQIDRNATISKEEGVRCPLCKEVGKNIEHGHTETCASCGLQMRRFGNRLQCTFFGRKD